MPLTLRDGVAVTSAGLAAIALGAAGWLALGAGSDAPRGEPIGALAPAAASPSAAPSVAPGGGALLVDVQGGVARPGLVRLAAGARVADAIAAAGGYAAEADLVAAAGAINLAAPLSDGQQVVVPLVGVAPPGGGAGGGGAGGGGGGGAGGGLVSLNSATPDELEALPGIGPVTVQKIVAARQERPFTTLDELVERKVMNRGQLDGIRALVTI